MVDLSDIDIPNITFGKSTSHLAGLARDNIRSKIERGRDRTARVIETVMNMRIQDHVAPARAVRWGVDDNGFLRAGFQVGGEEVSHRIHRNAIGQIAARAHTPLEYLEYLTTKVPERWGRDLVAHTLNEIFSHDQSKRLLRTVDGELRGFLSDRYRRRDTGVLVESFANALKSVGALPYEGHASDTRMSVQAILPQTFEPIPNEVVAYGVSFTDSSFGNGPTAVSLFVLRGVCNNGMISNRTIREVHVGASIDSERYEADTVAKDTEAVALKIRDTVRNSLNEEAIAAMQAAVVRAHADKISTDRAADILKRFLSKKEVETVMGRYNDPGEVVTLPEGQSRWRLANALSWFAGTVEDGDKRLEVQTAAGNLLDIAVPSAAEPPTPATRAVS